MSPSSSSSSPSSSSSSSCAPPDVVRPPTPLSPAAAAAALPQSRLRPPRRLSAAHLAHLARDHPAPAPTSVLAHDPVPVPPPPPPPPPTLAPPPSPNHAQPPAQRRRPDRPARKHVSATVAGRALLAKRLRGACPAGSSSMSSLAALAETANVSPVAAAAAAAALAPPDQIERITRSHRRRASESSGYFAAQTIKPPHADHLHPPLPPTHQPTKNRLITLADFRLGKVLGSGGTATVVRAEPLPASDAADLIPSKELALKTVPKRGLSRRAQHYLAREIAIHRMVQNHPNIASLYEVFEDSSGIYLALELMRGSDLYTTLKRERRGFSERVALTIMAQILDALNYMHSLGCAHRDIKPENLMFTERPNLVEGKLPPIKIIDFGLACARNPNAPEKDRTSSEKCGTIRYAAPEIVTETSYIPELCDIWSAGVVLYSIIAHRNPYTGKTEKEVLHQIQHSPLTFDGPEWEPISADTKNLISWCLSRKAADRPTAAPALHEVTRILHVLSGDEPNGGPTSHDARPSRRRSSKESQSNRALDLSGFSSNITREGSSSHTRRDRPSRGEEEEDGASSARSSSSDDGTSQPANFFDGLVKAWFSGSSPDRSGSYSS